MAFLLGSFLTGGVLGFSADRYMSRDQMCVTKTEVPLSNVMARRLGLSAEQSRKMDAILDHRRSEYHRVLAPVKPVIDSIRLEARDQMRQLLSPEQREQFEAWLKELNDSTRKNEAEA
jgi:Spy/CpxP family protein refolding chaperone